MTDRLCHAIIYAAAEPDTDIFNGVLVTSHILMYIYRSVTDCYSNVYVYKSRCSKDTFLGKLFAWLVPAYYGLREDFGFQFSIFVMGYSSSSSNLILIFLVLCEFVINRFYTVGKYI